MRAEYDMFVRFCLCNNDRLYTSVWESILKRISILSEPFLKKNVLLKPQDFKMYWGESWRESWRPDLPPQLSPQGRGRVVAAGGAMGGGAGVKIEKDAPQPAAQADAAAVNVGSLF